MVERILEVTRIQAINHYEDNQRPAQDSLKKRPQLSFQNILEKKMRSEDQGASPPYQVQLNVKR